MKNTAHIYLSVCILASTLTPSNLHGREYDGIASYEIINIGQAGPVYAAQIFPSRTWSIDSESIGLEAEISMMYFCFGHIPAFFGLFAFEGNPILSIDDGSHIRFGYRSVSFGDVYKIDGNSIAIDVHSITSETLVRGDILAEEVIVYLKHDNKDVRLTFSKQLTSRAVQDLAAHCR